ncbi:MAG: zinc metallopeptidase [Candidatus Latescibacteria bacterium]|nr:zinc metallopeptidase [Candidatus Latescibacterota bacterium]
MNDGGRIAFLLVPAVGLIVYAYLTTVRTYRRFQTIRARIGLTGAQVARQLLDQHGLHDVAVQEVRGVLSDRYDLRARIVRLSTDNYRSTSIAALGIAAHETGHALQHTDGYRPLTFRAAFILMAELGVLIAFALLFIGLLARWPEMVEVGAALFTGAVLCSLITLPVELNASRRALVLLGAGGYLTDREVDGAKTVLRAAAWTYVAAAVVALVHVLSPIVSRGDE